MGMNSDAVARPALRLADIVNVIRYALDLTAGQPAGHSLRYGWIGMHIGSIWACPMPPSPIFDYAIILKGAGWGSSAQCLLQKAVELVGKGLAVGQGKGGRAARMYAAGA